MERIKRLRQILTDPQTDLERAQRRLMLRIAVTAVAALIVIAVIFAMTSAWYSNTIQMNAISVQSDRWNFTGKITITDEAEDGSVSLGEGIRPGDGGVIPVTIENDDTQSVDIRVEADKSDLSDTMKKRIYFYVDTAQTDEEGNETVSRTYLNSRSGYLYEQIPTDSMEILTGEKEPESDGGDSAEALTEGETQKIYGSPLIQWEWVYDVTGYYVLGTVKETKNEETGETSGELQTGEDDPVPEYLMPVSYNLDQAVFDKDGQLEAVYLPDEMSGENHLTEGSAEQKLTREEYLTRLFQIYAQNYRGVEDVEYIPEEKATAEKPATQRTGDFYAVDVDENGYGVWLFLGDWNAIVAETEADALLGTPDPDETASKEEQNIKLIFKGQNSRSETETHQEDETAE